MMTHCVPTMTRNPRMKILSLFFLLSSFTSAWDLVGTLFMFIGKRRDEKEVQSVAFLKIVGCGF